jgi:arylsulfatase A-like enzyme
VARFGAPHYSMMAPKKYLIDSPDMECDRRTHLAMVAARDDVIGVPLNQSGTRHRTRYRGVVQADNGATNEVRASSYNSTAAEATVRIAATSRIVRWRHARSAISRAGPGGRAGVEPPDDLMDLMPTFVKMAGGPASAGIDGQDMLPVLRGQAPSHGISSELQQSARGAAGRLETGHQCRFPGMRSRRKSGCRISKPIPEKA